MDDMQVIGHKVLLLMKRNMHVLSKGRAPLPHAYKVCRYDLPRIAQQLILSYRVPCHRFTLQNNKKVNKKAYLTEHLSGVVSAKDGIGRGGWRAIRPSKDPTTNPQ